MTGILKNTQDNTKRPESQTAQAVSKLRLEMDDLEQLVRDLKDRLAPVLITTPEVPSPPSPQSSLRNEAKELLADLPQSIFCAASQAARLSQDISAMMANMQL